MADLTLAPQARFTGWDDLGVIMPFGKLFTYAAGSSNKLATYTDVAGLVPHTNPILLDAAGRVGSGLYLLPASYKFILSPSTDTDPPSNPVWTQDNIVATASFSVSIAIQGTAGENLALNDAIYESQGDGGRVAGRWYKVDADFAYASSLAVKIGWASAPILSGGSGQIQLIGRVTTQGLVVPGTVYYASSTAGAITAAAPINRRIIGVADSAGTLLLGIDQPWTATAQPLTVATTPAVGVGGALIRRTDGVRGLYMDSGVQWVSVNGGRANVKDFGALGDGTTNDRAAIQAAIDAASLTVAGVVYFPEGAYRIDVSANVGLKITRAITLIGASAAGVTLRGHGMTTGDVVIDIDGTVSPDLEQVHLSDLTVMSNDAARPDLINVNRVSSCSFTNLNLRDGRHGLILTGNRTFTHVVTRVMCANKLTGTVFRFSDAQGGQFTFGDCSICGAIGVSAVGSSVSIDSLVFNNCNWETCDQVASFTTTGLVRGVVFNGGRCEKNLAPFDFSPGAAGLVAGLVFNGMTFETDIENYAINCSGTGSVVGLIVQGCYAKDYIQYFVRLIDGEGGQIVGNTLEAIPAVVNDYSRAGMAVYNNRDQAGAELGPQWTTFWTTPPFDATNFTGSTFTWTVAAGDVFTYAYQIVGKLMTVAFRIQTSTVVTGGTALQIKIPASKTATKYMSNIISCRDNAATREPGVAVVNAGGTVISCTLMDETNWAVATDTTWVDGQITFEINTP